MKIFIVITIICAVIGGSAAAESRGVFKDDRYPGKCVVGKVIVNPGMVVKHPYSSCGRMLCGHGGYVVFQTCDVELPPYGYELGDVLEPWARFPKCCEREYIPIPRDD